jgi:hypothetical protein
VPVRLWDEAKEFIYLRRIALASERQATAIEQLTSIISEQFAAKPKLERKKTEFALMDVEEINKEYLRRLEAEQQGIELDED